MHFRSLAHNVIGVNKVRDMSSNIRIYNEDCLQAMKAMQDKQFDLAIVDPPYGIDMGNKINSVTGGVKHIAKDWDKYTPTQEYWDELFRVSKNQIRIVTGKQIGRAHV